MTYKRQEDAIDFIGNRERKTSARINAPFEDDVMDERPRLSAGKAVAYTRNPLGGARSTSAP